MRQSVQRLATKYVLFVFVILLQIWLVGAQMRGVQDIRSDAASGSAFQTAAACATIPAGVPSSTYAIQIPAAGTYTIWSRMLSRGDGANSFWLRLDSNCEIVVGDVSGMTANAFTWVNVRDGNPATRLTVTLAAGAHTITLFGREPNTGIDKLVFTTDLQCTPQATGNNCSGTGVTVSPTGGVGTTSLGVTLGLHGIGTGGDNANPAGGGTTQPAHPQRIVDLVIFDSQNQQAAAVSGTVVFSAQSGKFVGTTLLPSSIATGVYTVKVGMTGYLRKTVPGIISITKGQTLQLPTVILTTGDSNGDNLLSVLDYNEILDCYSDLSGPRNCGDAAKKQRTDLTDDGKVNEFDYNLFLRELSTQGGQ